MRQHARRIDIDGVAAGRLHDRHAAVGDVPAQVARGNDPVAQVIGIENFLQSHRDGVQIAAGQPAVGRKALGEDQQVGFLLRQAVVIGAKEAADIGEGVLLGGERAPVGQRKHLLRDLLGRPIRIPGFALADEPGVLREAAGVQV